LSRSTHLRVVLACVLELREQPLMEEHPVGHPGQRVVQRLILVLRLLDRELIGRLLQGVRSLEHLSCEQQRRQEDDDRPHPVLPETHHDEDTEQGERHV
jgi:hypothetical protein